MENRGSLGGYFLAGRDMAWFPVSIFQNLRNECISLLALIAVILEN